MKFLRLAALLLTCSSFSFAVNKDLVQLQRDLEDKINALQNDIDSKLSQLTGLITAMQNDTRRTADQVATLQDSVTNNVAKSLTPVNGLNTRVESMSDDVRALKDSIADLSSRLERMDAKITDLKNQMQIMQNPPAAPTGNGPGGPVTPGGPGTPSGQPGPSGAGQSVTPPPGMSADRSYTEALRDLQTGKSDLAYSEFQQFLTYFPNTELAANAQYYLGEIDYNRQNYTGAIQSFDAVLERYPDNPKTPDAHYMKAMALLKSNQRNKAVQEFRILVQNYSHTDDARKALQQLRTLGVSAGTSTARRKE
jgi:tol-pal system protein YbgF